MPRIKLAFWHDGHLPGAEIDVDDDMLKALRRDGRVAEVLPDVDEGGELPPAVTEAVNATGEPEPVVVPARRRKSPPQEE